MSVKYTITLSDKADALLLAEIDRNNRTLKRRLTPVQWIELHLKEVIIGQELAILMDAHHQKDERDAQVMLVKRGQKRRDDLIKALN